MPGPVFNKADQVPGTAADGTGCIGEARRQTGVSGKSRIQLIAKQVDNIQVIPFIVATNVIGLAHHALEQDFLNPPAVVLHIEPVAYVAAITIYRQRQAPENIGQAQGDQFFREVVGPVIIGAVTGGDLQAIGMVIGPHQMIRRCLTG